MMRKSYPYTSRDSGFAIVENLVALLLITLIMAAASKLFISTYHANANNRSDASVMADIAAELDEYRDESYRDFVYSVWTPGEPIVDGDSVTMERKSLVGRGAVETTFTAQKRTSALLPEAVHVRVVASTRRGIFGTKTSAIETVIAYSE